MILIFSLPWYRINGESHTASGIIRMIIGAGGVPAFARQTVGFTAEELEAGAMFEVYILWSLCICHLLLLLAEIVNFFRRIRRKPARILDAAVLVCTSVFAIFITNVTFIDFRVMFYVLLAAGAALAAFFGRKLIESSEEDPDLPTIGSSWKESFKRFQKWRKREKRHNSPEFYKIILKNFKSNARTFLLFFSSAAVSVMMIFMMMAMKFMLGGLYSAQSQVIGEGLSGIVKNAVFVLGAVSMFLMAFSLKFYMTSRMRDYGIFMVLGIRQRALSMLIVLEYAGSLVISILAGLLAGSIGAAGLRAVLLRYYPQSGRIAYPGISVYGITVVISVVLFAVSASINYDVYVESDLGNTLTKPSVKDRMPGKRKGWILGAGVLLAAGGVCVFSRRIFFEDVRAVFVSGAGCYLILRYGFSFILGHIRNQRKKYYRNILALNQFYYRFKSNTNYMFAVFLLDLFILFYFALQIIGNIPGHTEKLVPYDAVCLLDTDDSEYFQEFEDKYKAVTRTFPMLRLTVPDITPKREDPMNTGEIPEGQQIGISESSYEMLTGRRLDLKEKEIFISYQQSAGDNAHPIDFSTIFRDPHLRIGEPVNYYYLERKDIFPQDYPVAGEERNLMIGRLSGGYQENIVVFSDEYFAQVYPAEEGEKYLVLVNVPKEERKEALRELKQKIDDDYSGEVRYDSTLKRISEKAVKVQDIRAEQLLGLIVNSLLMAALVFGSMFIQFVRAAADIPDVRRRCEFLECMGINEEKNRQALCREFRILRWIPLGMAILVSGIFWGVTFWVRMFNAAELKLFLGWEMLILAVYLIVQGLAGRWMLRYIWKEVHK